MRIRDSARIVGIIMLVVVGALVIANIYGFYNMRHNREQMRITTGANAAVLDLNVLAAEMQIRRSARVRRQFDDGIARLSELLAVLRLGQENDTQTLARMERHTGRLKETFSTLESALDNDQFTDDQRIRAARALTQNFLASTTALASLSERLITRHIERIEKVERYLVILNLSTGLILAFALVSVSLIIRSKLLTPILELRSRIEGLVDIKDGSPQPTQSSRNELEEISEEFNRRISALRAADADKERYAEELKRSNKELEQFAYVASHDLRAPLKGIKMTASWIEEDMAEFITEDTRESLELLQSRADRLDDLLNSLLQYSRVNTRTHNQEVINLNVVVEDVSMLLTKPDGFTVEVIGELPNVSGVQVQVQQLFQNLIENAIKHHDREEGVITISAKEGVSFWAISVTDDGPGIAKQYHDKVQQIFQTLKRRDEKEASGMGLALVKKIIEQHGGKLTIDSPLNGRGCAMKFTWPKLEGVQ